MTGNAGFSVGDVLVDGVSVGAVSSYTFINLIANHMIWATFVPATYTITPSAGANGTIAPSTVQTVTINGSSPAFVMTPATGYHIADVLIDCLTNPGAIAAGTYTFTNVTANHTIAVSFAINTFTITPSAGPNGTISPPSIANVPTGNSQTYATTPAAGYHILSVLVDGVYVGAVGTYTFTDVTASHAIWATFEVDSVMAVTAPTGGGSYVQGSTLTIVWTAVPAYATREYGVFLWNGGSWYLGYIVPANGATTSYSQDVVLNVPLSTTYQAIVAYRTSSAAAWGQFAFSSGGNFSVTP